MVLSISQRTSSGSARRAHRKGIALPEPVREIPVGVYDGILVWLSDLGSDGVRARLYAALLDFRQLPYVRQRIRAAAAERRIVLELLRIRSKRRASVLSGAVEAVYGAG